MAVRSIQRVVACLAVSAAVAAVYFGRPQSGRSPDELAVAVEGQWAENRTAARQWMRRLPRTSDSAHALLKILASPDEASSMAAIGALHGLLDRRHACPDATDGAFVERMAETLADVAGSSALPRGVVDELTLRLLNWASDLEMDGQRVVANCAIAVEAAEGGREDRPNN